MIVGCLPFGRARSGHGCARGPKRGRASGPTRRGLGECQAWEHPYVRILNVASEIRITIAVARVLREFLSDTQEPRYGYDLMQATGYPSGKLYPILARLVSAGWLTREREDVHPGSARRPARFLYRLSEQGAVASRSALSEISQQISVPSPDPDAQPSRTPHHLWPDGVRT